MPKLPSFRLGCDILNFVDVSISEMKLGLSLVDDIYKVHTYLIKKQTSIQNRHFRNLLVEKSVRSPFTHHRDKLPEISTETSHLFLWQVNGILRFQLTSDCKAWRTDK